MADIKQEDVTLDSRIEKLEADMVAIARGVNTQAALLEAMVNASHLVVKTYVTLTTPPKPVEEAASVEETEAGA